ncbi:MAG: hypothetical protein FWC10_10595 [Lentimicrobiaceae bacterium]|nr:hypothetical protein [Lentimicrobiaceae bacterium]
MKSPESRQYTRKFLRIWKFIARPSVSGSPACAKPLGRYRQAADSATRE